MNNISQNPYSKENLLKALNSDDDQLVAAAERALSVCKYPDNYWVMPDYYYPGIGNKMTALVANFSSNDEKSRALLDATANDNVLLFQNFSILSKRNFRKCKPKEDSISIYNINFTEDEMISVSNEKDEVVEIPWSVLCGIFLKARELGYSRPDVLDHAGPVDKKLKEKWLANQEKIIELQSKID